MSFIRTLPAFMVASLVFFSCLFEGNGGSVDPFAAPRKKTRESFWVITDSSDYERNPDHWENIKASCWYEHDRVAVYVDTRYRNMIDADAVRAIGDEFNLGIWGKIAVSFGTPWDIDENSRTIIVLTDLEVKNLGGYFFSFDYYSEEFVNSYNRRYGSSLHTNEGDILYVDYFLYQNLKDTCGVIAHEFQHLVNFSTRATNDAQLLDTWIDEGLAEGANHLCFGVLNGRVRAVNDNAAKISGGHPLFYWSPFYDEFIINYSLSYLFFQYLRAQADDKAAIFRNIIRSSKSDFRAVIEAMNGDTALREWGSDDDERFNRLLLRWYATNSGVRNAQKYRYDDDIDIRIPPLAAENPQEGEVDLGSGAGVALNMADAEYTQVPRVDYLAVDNDGTDEDFTGTALRDKLIVVNTAYNVQQPLAVSVGLPAMKKEIRPRRTLQATAVPAATPGLIDLPRPAAVPRDPAATVAE